MRIKTVFIGNSIVAGYPWNKGKSFPSLVRRALKGELPEIPQPAFAKNTGFDIVNKGVNGDTTRGILQRFTEDVLRQEPDIVFFMTGTNDFIYREASPEDAFANLELMAKMLDDAGAKAVYITPVPVDAGKAEFMWMAGMGISYAAVNRDIDRLAQLIRESGRPYVDLTAGFPEFVESVGDVDLAYLDGIHPMPDGQIFIARQIIDFLEEAKDR
ncbi:MAG: GDSL-type esterase/lipase family protein [Clostridia bacterium]|nr:GDSL-type esterase/lipase family protein [Clostridia bacterium]